MEEVMEEDNAKRASNLMGLILALESASGPPTVPPNIFLRPR